MTWLMEDEMNMTLDGYWVHFLAPIFGKYKQSLIADIFGTVCCTAIGKISLQILKVIQGSSCIRMFTKKLLLSLIGAT